MDLSTLKLVMEKGPREGEALEYNSKPGLTIRVGRVVRGNTIAIKDNGISSKHLSIQCISNDKWVVKDLGSSNGTLLNGALLDSSNDLRDGDVLKIGEVTSIRVMISHFTDSQPVGRSLRSGRGRGRGNGSVNLEEDNTEIPVSKRSTRSSKKDEEDGGGECKAETEISLRRTTRSRVKKKDNSTFTSELERIPEASQLAVSDNLEVPNARATRGRKKKTAEIGAAQIATEVIAEQESSVAVKPEPQSNVDGIISKSDHSSKESMSEIAQKDGDLACQLNFAEASLEPDNGVVNPQGSIASKEKDEEAEIALDLNKMTLGEWLDHLEWSLPKKVRAETDQVIQDMRKISQQTHEYVLQYKKNKGKVILG